ncbi:MAG: T9SS type A sorting domain-containing protein [Candidatus Kapaibacterium sp.]
MPRLSRCVLLFILIVCCSASYASAQSFTYARQAGGMNGDAATRVAVDRFENSYVLGEFAGDVTFDNITIHGSAAWNIFVAKYDALGHVMWARTIIEAPDAYANAIGVDPTGNIYISGEFLTSAKIGDSTYQTVGGSDIYLVKLTNAGDLLWTRTPGGVGLGNYGQDVVTSLVTDALGNIYLTGTYNQDAKFGSIQLNSFNTSELFVAKYDPSGTALWATSGGEYGISHVGLAIALDSANNMYISGSFFGRLALGSDTCDAIDAEQKMFIAKLDQTGKFVWGKKVGSGGYYGAANDIAIDKFGDLITAGFFRAGITLNGTDYHHDFGYRYAVMVLKYDTAGNFRWVTRTDGGEQNSHVNRVATDGFGNIFLSGGFQYSTSFGTITPPASNDHLTAFIAKLNTAGKFLYVKPVVAQGGSSCRGLALTTYGACIAAGSFDTTASFDAIMLQSAGGSDVFFARIDNNIESVQETKLTEAPLFYPSPVFDQLHLVKDAKGEIRVMNLMGETILTSRNSNDLDLRNLPNGTYFLSVGERLQKFVKLKY